MFIYKLLVLIVIYFKTNIEFFIGFEKFIYVFMQLKRQERERILNEQKEAYEKSLAIDKAKVNVI